MSPWSKMHFLLKWWWVGLATFPRTLVQAANLFLKRGMSWVFRPEPRRNTIPRTADVTEIFIERLFRQYLRNLVESCEDPVIANYAPAGLVYGENETMASPSAQLAGGRVKILDFKVLTPSFYSRFVHYSDSKYVVLALLFDPHS